MKKVLFIVSLISICLNSNTLIFAQNNGNYITRAIAIEKVVTAIYTNGGGSYDFDFERYYCVHSQGNFHFVPDESLINGGYPILCEIYSSVKESDFSDVSSSEVRLSIFSGLAKSMGMINGYSDGTLKPNNAITYKEAIILLVSAFNNYKPNNNEAYFKIAGDMGITQNNIKNNDRISEKTFAAMLSKCLENPNAAINNKMQQFTPPKISEQCALAYGQSTKDRNGIGQYVLFSDELKESTKEKFEGYNWVTGVSSPWISDFTVNKIEDLRYEVVFNLSSGAGDEGTANLILNLKKFDDGIFRIISIEEI